MSSDIRGYVVQERVGIEGIEIPCQQPLISGFCADSAFNR